ncbi:M6 family metalloprotease domain-containing protein [Streptomyces sp. ISL-36]|uniref:M6 family metalloprotease domain-containing protein n=1 Tax=Streptomyces sp. ISL-36 TaxID=2819182 RepID=UPI0027E5575D|nr:M6 family metalloprotease domain-containing protein [Streptomyces sp. ISL-36]
MPERLEEWTATAAWADFCAVAPSPELRRRIQDEMASLQLPHAGLAELARLGRSPRWPGFDDGLIYPPGEFAPGTPSATIRSAAAERAPLQGKLKIAVIMVDFSDRAMGVGVEHVRDLFFSEGKLPNGSVREYFREVSGGKVELEGTVVPTVRLPKELTWYAHHNFGVGRGGQGPARAPQMADDAVVKANPVLDFKPFDNDGNGYIEAIVVVHAGPGAESTGNPQDIWSHKGVLPAARPVDRVKAYGYMAVGEDATIGVCAHELGHLLFGLPDLYDPDDSSMGIGNWCLMGTGSWTGDGGEVPVHPSAWCKLNQGWVTPSVVSSSGEVSFTDVKTSRVVHRLWTNGASGQEYFLIENRQRVAYDAGLPGHGLLIWHIDESRPDNSDENHLKVRLVQADNKRDLELRQNTGDQGDPYPGSTENVAFSATSKPTSHSHAGGSTLVAVTGISGSGPTMKAKVSVSGGKDQTKDSKDSKDRKDNTKDGHKDGGEGGGGGGGGGGGKTKDHPFAPGRKGGTELEVAPYCAGEPGALSTLILELQARVTALEQTVAGTVDEDEGEPFIGAALRPDLTAGPQYDRDDDSLRRSAEAGDPLAKRAFDSRPGQ